MTEDEFNQERYPFEPAVKGAIYRSQLALARTEDRIKFVPYAPALKAHAVWDLGVGQNLAIGIYQRVGAETHKIDYWQGTEKDGIPEAITALKAMPCVFAKMFVPYDAEGTESGTSKTRLATAKSLLPNVEWIVVPKLPVDDEIAKGRAMFSRLWIDESRCARWLDSIVSIIRVGRQPRDVPREAVPRLESLTGRTSTDTPQ